jgi:hypothetical protein
MRIILEKSFRVGIINKKINGFIDFSGKRTPFSYISSGFLSKKRELEIDSQLVVLSEGQAGILKNKKSEYSFRIKNTILEGLKLESLIDNVSLTARGVLISHPNKEGVSNLIFRTNGSKKGELVYSCLMDKNNLFVFYTKIHQRFLSEIPDKFNAPWELILFFILSIASNTGGYNRY